MTGPQGAGTVDDLLVVDEVGIVSGMLGEARLRALCEVVHARRGELLVPVAAMTRALPFRAGAPVPPEERPAAGPLAARLALAVVLRNHRNMDLEGLDLLFDAAALDQAPALGELLDEADLPAARAVGMLGREACPDTDRAETVAGLLRAAGARVALGGFGPDPDDPRRAERLRPDVVAVDRDWFRMLCAAPGTGRLFAALAGRLREQGASVLVAGIETPAELDVALTAGAELLAGPLLAAPTAVGAALDPAPTRLEALRGAVPIHQRR